MALSSETFFEARSEPPLLVDLLAGLDFVADLAAAVGADFDFGCCGADAGFLAGAGDGWTGSGVADLGGVGA